MTEHPDSTDSHQVRMVFVGSPLLDISEEVDSGTLAELGLSPDDCVQYDPGEHKELFSRLLDSPRARRRSGGSALNSAKIAKWTLGERGEVAFVGCIGADTAGSDLRAGLLDCGVQPLLAVVPGQVTGVCACLLSSSGRRAMVTRRGASALIGAGNLREEPVLRWLKTAHAVFAVGYLLAHAPDVVQTLAEILSPSQVLALGLSAAYVCREQAPLLARLLPRVQLLFGNEEEVKAIAAALNIVPEEQVASVTECVRALATAAPPAVGPRTVVCTRGAEPLVVAQGDAAPQHFEVPRGAQVSDGVGCGDALAGAFLASFVRTKDVGQSAAAGIGAALLIGRSPGCEPPKENFEATDL